MNQTKLILWGLLFLLMFLLIYLIHKRFKEKNVWNNLVKKYKDNTYQKILSEAKFVNKFGAIENKSLLYKLDRLVLTSGVKSVLPWMNGELLSRIYGRRITLRKYLSCHLFKCGTGGSFICGI